MNLNVEDIAYEAIKRRVEDQLVEATLVDNEDGTFTVTDADDAGIVGIGDTPNEALQSLARELFQFYGFDV